MKRISIIQMICLAIGLIFSIIMDIVTVFGTDVIAFTMLVLGFISLIGQSFIKKSVEKDCKFFIASNVLVIAVMVLFSIVTRNGIFTDFEFVLLSQHIYIFNKAVQVVAIERMISICCCLSLGICFISVIFIIVHKLIVKTSVKNLN